MSGSIDIDPSHSALLIVDMQPDFMPGGALPVQGQVSHQAEIVGPIRVLMEARIFDVQVATQDWHPRGHASFASSHPGRHAFDVIKLHGHDQTLWPDHCLQDADGARLHRDLDLTPVSAIIRKGTEPDVDSYSGFRNNWNADGERPPTGLAGYLRERGIDRVFCCGLARDVCVKWTAEDGVNDGFETFFIWDLTWPVDPDNDRQVRAELQSKGVHIVVADQLARSSSQTPETASRTPGVSTAAARRDVLRHARNDESHARGRPRLRARRR